MKYMLLLILLTVLVYSIRCKHSKGPQRREHEKLQLRKSKFHSITKHGFKKTKRVVETIDVDLKDRKIRGSIKKTETNQKIYYLFQGVPYAKPPVGDLRFEPPQPYQWEGRYDATYQRNVCIQNSLRQDFKIVGSEDCLYLNIYAPQASSSSSLSVLVWIYGGAFFGGDGNYETYPPDHFIDQNLVVVTLNYRVGVFGFLTTGDDVVPGNMGLKDQVMALKWVQENIQYFRGDPSNVTIMGESAGGASVAYLVQSPTTKGYFKRAIAHSGSSLCPWSLSRRGVSNTMLLARKNFIFSNNTTKIIEGLKKVNYLRLFITSGFSMSAIFLLDPLNGLVYAPVMEPPNPTAFFAAESYEQLNSCNFTSVPLIIGYNSEEARGADTMLGLLKFYLAGYDLNPSGLVPLDMNVNSTAQIRKLGDEIKTTYVGSEGLMVTSDGINKYLTDHEFIRPTMQYAKLYSGCGKNVFQYRFSYTQNSRGGVRHAEELQYFFYYKNLKGGRTLKFSSDVVKLWTNFIKTGNPTPNSNEFNVTWYPSTKTNNYSYLDLGEDFMSYNQETNPDKRYLNKWTNWYDTYGNRPFDTY